MDVSAQSNWEVTESSYDMCHVSAGKKFKAATMLVMFQLRVAGKYFRVASVCVMFQLRVAMNKLSVATIIVLF